MAKPKKNALKRKRARHGTQSTVYKKGNTGSSKKKRVATPKKKTSKTRGKTERKAQAKPAPTKPERVSAVKTLGVIATDDDPLGACYYVDNFGQNVCEENTKNQCASIPGSKFSAGGRCN